MESVSKTLMTTLTADFDFDCGDCHPLKCLSNKQDVNEIVTNLQNVSNYYNLRAKFKAVIRLLQG